MARRDWIVWTAVAVAACGCGAAPAPQGPVTVVAPTAPEGVSQLIIRVGPAVVNINTVSGTEAPVSDSDDQASREVERSVGSGFVLRADGLIVTNRHVVEKADRLVVTLDDGRRFTGRVVGTDKVTDLALLRVDVGGLPTLTLADPASVQAGEFVVALGSPLGLQKTATWGIVSATERIIAQNPRVAYVQTDAPINPGNSGGPLVDLEGRVVGVSTAIATEAQGIGFAIPVEALMRVLPQLEASGAASHAWLGVTVATSVEGGAVVREVDQNGPAAAGLRVGDRVVSLDGRAISGAVELIRMVEATAVGTRVRVGLVRDGRIMAVDLRLAELPRD